METNNFEFMFHVELSSPISLMCFQTLDGKGWNDGARRADGCVYVNTFVHSPDGEGFRAVRVQEESLPWHHGPVQV